MFPLRFVSEQKDAALPQNRFIPSTVGHNKVLDLPNYQETTCDLRSADSTLRSVY